jgi:hypothetical protein
VRVNSVGLVALLDSLCQLSSDPIFRSSSSGSVSRFVSEQGKVTFRWRDSAHANKQRLLTLPVDEFLRRFLLHLLPRGFVRIRNFGFLANPTTRPALATLLPVAHQCRRRPGSSGSARSR